MPAKLLGKSLSDVLNMKTVPDDDDHNKDAVSGATVWSDAIRHATIAALQLRAGQRKRIYCARPDPHRADLRTECFL